MTPIHTSSRSPGPSSSLAGGAFGSAYESLNATIFGRTPQRRRRSRPFKRPNGLDQNGNSLFPGQLTQVGPASSNNAYAGLSHLQLAGDPTVISDVAAAVDARRPSLQPDQPSRRSGNPSFPARRTQPSCRSATPRPPTRSPTTGDPALRGALARCHRGDTKRRDPGRRGDHWQRHSPGSDQESDAQNRHGYALSAMWRSTLKFSLSSASLSPVVVPVPAIQVTPVLAVSASTHVILPQQDHRSWGVGA